VPDPAKPADVDYIADRAAVFARLIRGDRGELDGSQLALNAGNADVVRDILAEDVPALVRLCRAWEAYHRAWVADDAATGAADICVGPKTYERCRATSKALADAAETLRKAGGTP
jgi:hypothetical protein